MSSALLQRWRELAGRGADVLGEALIAAWSEPQRHYHSAAHLIWLLDEATRRAALIHDGEFVGYAIWFHDAVYNPGAADNESLSAAWARSALGARREFATRVSHVVEMTKNHAVGEAVGDAALFLDMDIAILGESQEVYSAYAEGIRREFDAFPDEIFAAGRIRFLQSQLAHPRLFRSDFYESERGSAARNNMTWELETLLGGRMVRG